MDGILGLAYDTISVDGLPTFIDSSDLEDKSFSFFLGDLDEQSYLILPGYDSTHFTGDFDFHPVVEQKYYSIKFDSMVQAGQDSIDMSDYKAVIDSGTSVIVGPEDEVNQLISGIKVPLFCDGIEDLPNITFTFDGVDFELTPDDYVLKVSNGIITECELAIMPTDFPKYFKYMIFGDTLMRKWYTYFDKKNNQVGFAEAIHA